MTRKKQGQEGIPVTILKAGVEEGDADPQDIALLPGTTVGAVLDKLGLKNCNLNKPDPETGFFKRTDDLYAVAKEGDKFVTTLAGIGAATP